MSGHRDKGKCGVVRRGEPWDMEWERAFGPDIACGFSWGSWAPRGVGPPLDLGGLWIPKSEYQASKVCVPFQEEALRKDGAWGQHTWG